MIDILNKVKEYINEKHASKKWEAGKDWVQYAGPYFNSDEYKRAIETFLKGWLVLGNEAIEFEKKFPLLFGKECGIVTNSGSSANLLMVSALMPENLYGLQKGSKIAVPVAGFPTTLNPILQCGYQPVFIDIELDTLNLDVDDLERKLKYHNDIKVIMFAHVLGNPPDMNRIMQLVKQYNLILLEDCCDALGSTYDNKPLGSFGEMASCSFYPAHHITAGEGGFVTCKTKEAEKVVRSLREWGRGCYCVGKKANLSKKGTCGCRYNNWLPALPDEILDHKYTYDYMGYNLKPIELQCSMLLEQIKKLPNIHSKRVHNYNKLTNIFNSYEEYFILPKAQKNADVSWFAFPLTLRDTCPFKRSQLTNYLEDHLIQTRNYFGGNLLLQNAYKKQASSEGGYIEIKQKYPNATKVTTDTFFLGVSPVITDEQLNYVAEVVDNFMRKYVTNQS